MEEVTEEAVVKESLGEDGQGEGGVQYCIREEAKEKDFGWFSRHNVSQLQ